MRSATVLMLATLLAGCGRSADDVARSVFAMPVHEAVDTGTLRSAVLHVLPLGTPESDVLRYLKQHELLPDSTGVTGYESTGANLFVRLNDERWRIVKTSFAIHLTFDEHDVIQAVKVERWLTGP